LALSKSFTFYLLTYLLKHAVLTAQVVKGAASCFFAYIGFDTIATSGEESSKPTKHVPIAIVSTLVICLLSYVDVSAIMTLLVPWNTLSGSAALPKAFAQV